MGKSDRSPGTASLHDIDATEELARRPTRLPDHAAENRALVELARCMNEAPQSILQKLSEMALELCQADSAGISILETDRGKPMFRWYATAGDFEPYLGGVTSRHFSPCGVVLDRNSPQLMVEPVRYYPYIAELSPHVHELLLIPFYRGDTAIGTVWVVGSHESKRFDAEDSRLITNLSLFASAAVQEQDGPRDDFLAVLAHELRNPLAAISNAVTLMTISKLKEHLDYAIATARRQTTQLARLVDELMDVSRINLGKIELRCRVLDATAILDSAVHLAAELAAERQHTLDVAIERGNLWVEVDPTRLEQIIVNLLNNAAKHSENGGTIRLSAAHEDGEVVIRVRETGIGIAPEEPSTAFELLRQGDRYSCRSEGGLGIGLTLVKKLVELQGGTIIARGVGKGCECVVRLPASSRPLA
jgi:signal transduction histidine kinase